MKKSITLAGFSVLFLAALLFTAATTQQGKEKNNNGQSQKENKGKNDNQPGKAAKNDAVQKNQPGNQGKNDKNPGNNKNDNGKGIGKGNNNDNDNGKNKGNKGNDKNDNAGRGKFEMKDGYAWDRETFKDRRKFKNKEKVTICHKFNGNNNEPAVTINVSENALKAHMNHGDVRGTCPTVKDSRFSDVFLRNRNDYYNNVQNHYEQVSYSRSILDYAVARLTNSRQQLVTMQNSGLPVAQIESKQASVVQLEQNVSLLETLIGVATTIVAEKLL